MWGGGFPAQGKGPRQEWVDFVEMKKAARWRPQKALGLRMQLWRMIIGYHMP